MHRLPSFRRLLAPLPLRWRLALVSLGLLAMRSALRHPSCKRQDRGSLRPCR